MLTVEITLSACIVETWQAFDREECNGNLTMNTVVVLVLLLDLVLGDFNILLLHTNDMHAHFLPVSKNIGACDNDTSADCYGGFARVKYVADQMSKQAKVNGRETIFLNAGDSYQGTAYYTFYKWEIVARFVDMLGLDVMVSLTIY